MIGVYQYSVYQYSDITESQKPYQPRARLHRTQTLIRAPLHPERVCSIAIDVRLSLRGKLAFSEPISDWLVWWLAWETMQTIRRRLPDCVAYGAPDAWQLAG